MPTSTGRPKSTKKSMLFLCAYPNYNITACEKYRTSYHVDWYFAVVIIEVVKVVVVIVVRTSATDDPYV